MGLKYERQNRMSVAQTITFPDELHAALTGRVAATPGAKFSPLIVALIEMGLEAEKATTAKSSPPVKLGPGGDYTRDWPPQSQKGTDDVE